MGLIDKERGQRRCKQSAAFEEDRLTIAVLDEDSVEALR